MIVLIILTFLFHLVIKRNYLPVIDYLPISLAPRTESEQADDASQDLATPVKGEKLGEPLMDRSQAEESIPSSHEFDHPARWESLKPVWLPHDPLGLSTEAINSLSESKVLASDAGAEMSPEGKVTVTR